MINNIFFYIILIIDFYVLPFFIKDTGSGIAIMLLIIPMICLLNSVFYGLKNGFDFWYLLIIAIMFLPSIFIFYNYTAWIYAIIYPVIGLFGNSIALLFK